MSDPRLKIAVFIDFDNIEIGVKTTLGRQFDIGAVLEAVKERGEIITKVAYGDWKRAGDHSRAMAQHAVRLVQRVMTPGGDKNGADINLALDALEMAFTHDHINAFVIVGGDSDFITLVEKLKQYDKKVFVVGGRAFSSQVMQKNCTEFIAYENIMGSAPSAGAGVGGATASHPRGHRGDRGRAASAGVPLDQALPLVKRALKVLADREVSPQLGLLKSTLLQLDSSFSERDYGASTFRDFAERLEKQGFVTLKHSGRTTIVELAEEGAATSDEVAPSPLSPAEAAPTSDDVDEHHAGTNGNIAEGVALIRSILAEASTPPRWPMYVRQMKQFIRNARPDFDERRYGSILDLMRACQKDGFLRLERDRQGGLRVFASGPVKTTNMPHGWSTLTGHAPEPAEEAPVIEASVIAEETVPMPVPPVTKIEDDDNRGNLIAAEEPRPKRTRKTAAGTAKRARSEQRIKNKDKKTKNKEQRTDNENETRAAAARPKRASRRRASNVESVS